MKEYSRGFSFIELIVVFGIVATLSAVITVTLLGAQRRPALTGVVDTFIADVRKQQGNAMNGAGSLTASDYGIYVDTASYVLFRGSTYNAADTSNSSIQLSTGMTIASTGLPSRQMVFSKGSGEVVGYFPGSDFVTFQSVYNSEQKIVTINRLGAIISVQ